ASSDGNFRVDLEEPPNPATSDHGGSCRTDLGGRSEPQEQTAFQEVEDSDQTRGGHWRTDPTPQHWTLHSAGKRFPSLPLLHMETSGHDGMLESLWPGDPVQESYSNTLERHLNPNPLREIKYIKGRIWQRLGSSKSSRDSKTFPPLSCSPRSLMPARLKPLSKESSRNEETNSSSVGLKSDNPAKWRGVGQPYEQKLQKSLQSSEDIVLSGDLAQVSLDSCIYSVKQHRWRDDRSSNAGERRSRNGSGREETGIQTSPIDIKPGTCTETGCSQTDHLQLHQPSESFRKSRASAMEKEDLLETKDDTKLKIHDKSKTSEENLWLATSTNEDTKKKTDPQNMDSSRTPKADHISFVHITFSEQKPQTEINYSPSKPLFMKRKMKTVSLLYNVNHSFNVLGQKENTKTKKIRKTRILSAPDSTKRQRPLSNSNRIHGKSVPLPTLVNSSVPSPSKVSKKVVFSAPRSIEQSSQRSQTQLSLYPQKRITSPSTTPILPRSKSSHDFQDIKYSDMFVELSQQGAGPVMYQMFPPTVYGSPCRETNSTSSTRSCSSKASHVSSSRDNSARSKRPKLKNKKDPSAASHSRRNSSSKQEGREKLQNKMENMVIISGEDWEIQTKKQDGDNVELPNVELPTINEATIENSVTITGTVKEIFKMSREMEGNSHNVQPSYPANVDHGLLQEVGEMGCVQQDVGVINSNCHKDMDDNVQGSTIGCTPPSDQDLNATEICPLFKQDEALGDWMYHDSCQKRNSVELKDHAYSLSKNIQKSCSLAGSDYLTADLISCLENLILTDDESSSLVMEDKEDGEQRRKFHEHNEADDPNQLSNIQQVTTNPSLTDQKSHTNICNSTANQPEHNDDSAIHWIKGEVLGRGAYGTVKPTVG
ncbi:hypothetical protein GDO78_020548, partial [Eleutherodactylus coqui]